MTSAEDSGLDLVDEDDDYDYLPLPEVDENYLDPQDGEREVLRRRPFACIHDPPQPFDSHSRRCYLSGQKVTVEIINVEKSDSSYILNPYLYSIQVTHADFKWIVRRRYKHFRHLHDQLTLTRTKAMLSVVTKESRERRKTFVKTHENVQPFPKRPEALVRSEGIEERRQQLEAYLQSLLRCSQYRNHPETLRFLEISQLSFVSGLGNKLKEGLVDKQAGGRRVSLNFFSCLFCCQSGNWQERWLIVKDSFVAYIKPSNGMIRDVILMDRDFSVKAGLMATRVNHGVLISNMSRHLLLKAYTDRKAQEWHEDLQKAIDICGSDYIQPNRHDSFVPVRQNSYANWFVDGASYMAAVADAIEAAREEIFITDWMLSPELYLKRPNMEKDKDKWRLDLLLQRKARAGVKIFILVYKELEMALGINSYYTKHALMSKHENIKVMRHPDGIKLWSHHEKCVVVDQRLAFLGGIDLCYGRWDTRKHRLTDYGSVSLSNIYGNQDNDTLQNVLSNRPNLVPKIADLLAKANARQASAGDSQPSSPLATISEDPGVASGGVDPGQVNLREGQSFDTVDIGEDNLPPEVNGTDEERLVKRDANGCYLNPAQVPTPTDERRDFRDLIRAGLAAGGGATGDATYNVEAAGSDEATTLQTFLRNFIDKTAEISEPVPPSPAPLPEEIAAIKEDRSGHLNPDMPTGQEKKSKRDQLVNLFDSFRSSHRSAGGTRRPAPSRQESMEEEKAYVASSDDEDEKPKHDGEHKPHHKPEHKPDHKPEHNEGRPAVMPHEPKPTTPKPKRKLGLKTIANLKVMFNRAESIDVTDDDMARPWDESVYKAREEDIRDQDLDAKLNSAGLGSSLKIWVGKDYVNFIFKDFVELDNPFTDMVDRTITPRMPWHDIGATVFGKPARDVARHFIQRWNFTKLQKRKTADDIPMLLPKSNANVSVPRWAAKSTFCCNCQILRSCCEWSAGIKYVERSILNAYIDLIENSKHYVYIENQFFISINHDRIVENGIATALYERIVKAHEAGETFRVYVIIPLLPAFEGQLGTSTGISIQAVIHWNYQSICRGGNSLLERLVKKVNDPFKYISFYGLRKHDEMLGTLVSELVYVHSKLMIVDDHSVIIASANINDRSMLGYRDSELGILVQDTRSVMSRMNGQTFKAGAFACSLRKSLFREHLGLESNSEVDVSDPISTDFYKNVWLKQASINTVTYDKVFRCLPTDEVLSLQQLLEYEKQPKLCVTDPNKAKEMLQKVSGQLVLLPLQFLSKENLAPAVATKEGMAPTVMWT